MNSLGSCAGIFGPVLDGFLVTHTDSWVLLFVVAATAAGGGAAAVSGPGPAARFRQYRPSTRRLKDAKLLMPVVRVRAG